jgi:O-antigen ligase
MAAAMRFLNVRSMLAMAVIISPFTLLRFTFFGVAEILILVAFLQQVFKPIRKSEFKKFWLTRYWLAYLVVSILGMLCNAVVLDRQTSTWPQIVFDLSAYVFVLITCFTLERLATHTAFNIDAFIKQIFFGSGMVFSVLFVASFFTPSLFGLPIKYYDYFVPWAENLHQVSMYLVPLPFLGLIVFARCRGLVQRALILVLIPLFAIMAISTGSAKAELSVLVGTFIFVYSYLLKRLGRKYFVLVNLACACFALLVASSVDLIQVGRLAFQEEDVGGARDFLYVHGLDLAMQSPFVGRGPGPHVYFDGGYIDAHETFLTAALQGGALGLAALLILVAAILRRRMYDPALLSAFSTLLLYAAGGDILRRLSAWICMFVIVHYGRQLVPIGSTRKP